MIFPSNSPSNTPIRSYTFWGAAILFNKYHFYVKICQVIYVVFSKKKKRKTTDRPPIPIEQAQSNGPGCWSVEAVALPGPWIAIQCGTWRRMAIFSRTCSMQYYTEASYHITHCNGSASKIIFKIAFNLVFVYNS